LILLIPGAGDAWQYDRQAISAGQFWRLLTGHLTHWNGEHAFWDLLMFVVLGVMVEGNGRLRFSLLCLGSAFGISLATWYFLPDVALYRGLSGVDTALFVYLACSLLGRAWQERSRQKALIPMALLVGFTAKWVYEVATGAGLFVDSCGPGFTVLASAHLAGALIGTWAGLMSYGRAGRAAREFDFP
jgi:rhomboid family GlyGly-CTERM serine protease